MARTGFTEQVQQGKITPKFVIAKTLVKDVVFEETFDTNLMPEDSSAIVNSHRQELSFFCIDLLYLPPA